MGLFGPSKQEMQDAVADGIHQSIRTSTSRTYHIKQGKKMVAGEYYVVPPEISVQLYSADELPVMPAPRKIRMPNGYFIIYDVIYRTTKTRYNPFTDVTTTDVVSEDNVARYYSYDGYDLDKINRFIRFARENGFYPTEKHLEKWALSEHK